MQSAMRITIRIFPDSCLEGSRRSLEFYSDISYILSISEHALSFLSI